LRSIVAVLVLSLVAAFPRASLAEDAAVDAERRTIEALIASVAGLGDATFIRNGQSYDASKAARFLREKWKSRESEVRTADEFIERVASFSSTTSKPYLIRFTDGREIQSADFLRAELARLRRAD
jgi:membrane-bound lytic murein transglycosylase